MILSITNARDEIAELLENSPGLTEKLPDILARRYPAACPFTVEQLLDSDDWT